MDRSSSKSLEKYVFELFLWQTDYITWCYVTILPKIKQYQQITAGGIGFDILKTRYKLWCSHIFNTCILII